MLDPEMEPCEVCGNRGHVDYHIIGDIRRAMMCMDCVNKITRHMILNGLQAKIDVQNSIIRALEYGVDEATSRIKNEIEEAHTVKNMLQRQMIDWIDRWFEFDWRM